MAAGVASFFVVFVFVLELVIAVELIVGERLAVLLQVGLVEVGVVEILGDGLFVGFELFFFVVSHRSSPFEYAVLAGL